MISVVVLDDMISLPGSQIDDLPKREAGMVAASYKALEASSFNLILLFCYMLLRMK